MSIGCASSLSYGITVWMWIWNHWVNGKAICSCCMYIRLPRAPITCLACMSFHVISHTKWEKWNKNNQHQTTPNDSDYANAHAHTQWNNVNYLVSFVFCISWINFIGRKIVKIVHGNAVCYRSVRLPSRIFFRIFFLLPFEYIRPAFSHPAELFPFWKYANDAFGYHYGWRRCNCYFGAVFALHQCLPQQYDNSSHWRHLIW